MRFRQPFILTCRWEIDSIFLCDRRLRGKIASGAYALFGFFARSPPFGSYRAKKTDCGLPLTLNFLPRSRLLTFHNGYLPALCQTKIHFDDEESEVRNCGSGLRLPFQDLRPGRRGGIGKGEMFPRTTRCRVYDPYSDVERRPAGN